MGDVLWFILWGFVGALLFLVVLVLGLYFGFKFLIRRKLKEFTEKFGELAAMGGLPFVPPMRIELEQDNDLTWMNEAGLKEAESVLQQAGFQPAGDYISHETMAQVRGYVHPEKGVSAAITALGGIKQWVDLVTIYDDDTSCTHCGLEDTLMDQPPWRKMVYCPDTSADALLERHLAERSADRSVRKVKPEEFRKLFESRYAKEMNWRIERGGVTEEEIRRVISKDGTGATPDAIRSTQLMWRNAIAEFLSGECTKRYLKESQLSAVDYEPIEDRVFVIHDRMTPEGLLLHLQSEDENEDDDTVDEEEGTLDDSPALQSLREHLRTATIRQVYARHNSQRPVDKRASKLGEVTKPVAADIYVGPEADHYDSVDEDDDDES